MSGLYFKMMNDITLPADWTPLGCTKDGSIDIKRGENLHAFSGILDGNGKTLTVPKDGLPLLGYVNGSRGQEPEHLRRGDQRLRSGQ